MAYVENPKTRGSGILCCIPQKDKCPFACADCFFMGRRSYLEPLEEHLPNMPTSEEAAGRVVRVNDGNDSHVGQDEVMAATRQYPMRFYNTSVLQDLERYDAPVVLTANPGVFTDLDARLIIAERIPPNLMFVRVRTNTWNLSRVVDPAVAHYTALGVPVVLTFMAYFAQTVPAQHAANYVWRKRTTNPYWAITTSAWEKVMARYRHNPMVHSCGKVEGELGTTACRHCGNCLREYFATEERMRARRL